MSETSCLALVLKLSRGIHNCWVSTPRHTYRYSGETYLYTKHMSNIEVSAHTSQEVKKLDSWDWTIDIWRPQGILFLILGGISPVVGIAHWKTAQNLDWEDGI